MQYLNNTFSKSLCDRVNKQQYVETSGNIIFS